jgi:hypothetical protein
MGVEVGGARELGPVGRRSVWVAWGLTLEVIGAGIPVTVAVLRAKREGLLGSVTHYTVRLIEHEMLRSHADVALIILGVLVFAAGAVVLARPFVRRRVTLFVAVPVAAAAGIVILGVVALICAIVVAIVSSAGDGGWASGLEDFIPWSTDRTRRRRRR